MTTAKDFCRYAPALQRPARAQAAYAAAEAARDAGDLATAAALKSAAQAWERRPVAWSTKPMRQQLTLLRVDVALATGPFQPPKTPKAAPPAQVDIHSAAAVRARHEERVRSRENQTIEF